jgi:hypothetical protein
MFVPHVGPRDAGQVAAGMAFWAMAALAVIAVLRHQLGGLLGLFFT